MKRVVRGRGNACVRTVACHSHHYLGIDQPGHKNSTGYRHEKAREESMTSRNGADRKRSRGQWKVTSNTIHSAFGTQNAALHKTLRPLTTAPPVSGERKIWRLRAPFGSPLIGTKRVLGRAKRYGNLGNSHCQDDGSEGWRSAWEAGTIGPREETGRAVPDSFEFEKETALHETRKHDDPHIGLPSATWMTFGASSGLIVFC